MAVNRTSKILLVRFGICIVMEDQREASHTWRCRLDLTWHLKLTSCRGSSTILVWFTSRRRNRCCGTSGAPKTWASHTGETARHTWQGTQTQTTRAARTTAKAWLDTVSATGVAQPRGQRRNRQAWPCQRQKQRFTHWAKQSRKHFTYKLSWSALARRNKEPFSATPNRVWHWSLGTMVATKLNTSPHS